MPIVLNDANVHPGDGWVWNAYAGRWRNVENEVTEPELRNQAMLTAVANWIGRPLPHVGAWIRLMQLGMKLIPDEWIAATATNGLHVVGPPPTGVPVVAGRSTPQLRSLPGQVEDLAAEVAAILAAVYEPVNPVPFVSKAGAFANGEQFQHGSNFTLAFQWGGGSSSGSWSGVGFRSETATSGANGWFVMVLGDGNTNGRLNLYRVAGGTSVNVVGVNGVVPKNARVTVQVEGETLRVYVGPNLHIERDLVGYGASWANGRTFIQAGGLGSDVFGQAAPTGIVASAPAASYVLRELANGLFDWGPGAGQWPAFRYLGQWKGAADIRRPVVSALGTLAYPALVGQTVPTRRANAIAHWALQVGPWTATQVYTPGGQQLRSVQEVLAPFITAVGDRALLSQT